MNVRAFELLDKWKNCDRREPFRFSHLGRCKVATVTPVLWGQAWSMRRPSSVQRTKAFLPSWRPACALADGHRRRSDAVGTSGCTRGRKEHGLNAARSCGSSWLDNRGTLPTARLSFHMLSQDYDNTDSSKALCQDFRLINPIARGQEEVECGSRAGLGSGLFQAIQANIARTQV